MGRTAYTNNKHLAAVSTIPAWYADSEALLKSCGASDRVGQ